jgi:hypothetical protein
MHDDAARILLPVPDAAALFGAAKPVARPVHEAGERDNYNIRTR